MDSKKTWLVIVILIVATVSYFNQTNTEVRQEASITIEPTSPGSESSSTPVSSDQNIGQLSSEIELPITLQRPLSSLFKPAELISIHFTRLIYGDIDSAHVISEVLRFCARMPTSQIHLERILKMEDIPDDVKDLTRIHFPQCAQAKAEHPKVFGNQNDYIGSNLARQHPLHRLTFQNVTLVERKALLRHLFSSGFEHQFLKGEALQHASWMFTAYPGYEDIFLSSAIQVTACKYEKHCDPHFYNSLLKKQYPPSKHRQLLNLSEQIDEGINNGDLSLLQL